MLYDVPDHDWFTITIDQTTVIMCVGNGVTNCYSELEETTFDGVPPEGKELVEIPDFPDHDTILRQFTRFSFNLHEKGIEFLDHSPGNTLIKKKY